MRLNKKMVNDLHPISTVTGLAGISSIFKPDALSIAAMAGGLM